VIDEKIKVPTFYKLCDFKGTKVEIDTSIGDVGDVGIAPNAISSFKVPMDYLVTICDGKDYEGTCKVFEPGSVHCLVSYQMEGGENWDDKIESIKIQSAKVLPLAEAAKGNNEQALEALNKEKSNKKEEEIQVEKNAKTRIKLKQDQLMADRAKHMRFQPRRPIKTANRRLAPSPAMAVIRTHQQQAEPFFFLLFFLLLVPAVVWKFDSTAFSPEANAPLTPEPTAVIPSPIPVVADPVRFPRP